MKEKKQGKLSFRVVLLLSALIPLAAATIGSLICSYFSTSTLVLDQIRSQLRTSVYILNGRLTDMAAGQQGTWHIGNNDTLFLGAKEFPSDIALVDCAKDEDVQFTIFFGDIIAVIRLDQTDRTVLVIRNNEHITDIVAIITHSRDPPLHLI